MVTTYFEIGRMIVEEEQNGKERAEYGKQLIKGLSDKLTKEFNKGFSVTNLKQMKTFYLVYRKGQTVSDQSQKQQRLSVKSVDFQLSWSHYLKLMRIDKQEERKFYEIEAIENNWSLRELQRQFDTSLYERLALSRDKKGVKALSEKGREMKAAIINSKGFGGNNATGLILSPQTTMQMLENRHGPDAIARYKLLNEKVRAAATAYDNAMINGEIEVIYHFGSEVMSADDLVITETGIKLSKFENELAFDQENPFSDYR